MTTVAVIMWKKRKNLLFVFLVELGVFLFEFLDSTCSINQFLLAGEKGVAGGTDFNLHFTVDRAELEFIAAGTDSIYFMVFWMDIRFHFSPPNIFFPSRECSLIKGNYPRAPYLRMVRTPSVPTAYSLWRSACTNVG